MVDYFYDFIFVFFGTVAIAARLDRVKAIGRWLPWLVAVTCCGLLVPWRGLSFATGEGLMAPACALCGAAAAWLTTRRIGLGESN